MVPYLNLVETSGITITSDPVLRLLRFANWYISAGLKVNSELMLLKHKRRLALFYFLAS